MKPFLFAKRFVAGDKLEDAIEVAKKLGDKRLKVTFDHLGEDVMQVDKANEATRTYVNILHEIKKNKLDSNISIKLSQIGLAIDKKLAYRNVDKIVRRAKSLGVLVEIDMEGSRYIEDTLDIFLRLIKYYKNVIQAIQSYLYRSEEDVSRIIRNKGKIRLIKGAYKESEKIAFMRKKDVNENYVKLMKSYLNRGVFIAIATHDDKIIDIAKRYIKRNNISNDKYEFEMLYGIRRIYQEELVNEGYNVRIYLPYGEDWFPYFYRRVRERKENLFFVLRHLFRK